MHLNFASSLWWRSIPLAFGYEEASITMSYDNKYVWFITGAALFVFVPFVSLTLLTWQLLLAVRKSRVFRKSMRVKSRDSRTKTAVSFLKGCNKFQILSEGNRSTGKVGWGWTMSVKFECFPWVISNLWDFCGGLYGVHNSAPMMQWWEKPCRSRYLIKFVIYQHATHVFNFNLRLDTLNFIILGC